LPESHLVERAEKSREIYENRNFIGGQQNRRETRISGSQLDFRARAEKMFQNGAFVFG
jgi:hypothetical protein